MLRPLHSTRIVLSFNNYYINEGKTHTELAALVKEYMAVRTDIALLGAGERDSDKMSSKTEFINRMLEGIQNRLLAPQKSTAGIPAHDIPVVDLV